MTENISKPFDIGWVVNTTIDRMQKDIDFSVSKTITRLADFPENSKESKEAFTTLIALNTLKRDLNERRYPNSAK